jgi:hypothetical protein
VIGIEIEDCARRGGNLKVIASIDEPTRVLTRRPRAAGFWPTAEP